MRYLFSSSAIALIALVHATPVQAGCSGGVDTVGSANLSCTTNSGTLADYKTWVETEYVPAALKAVMESVVSIYNASVPGLAGNATVQDKWGVGTPYARNTTRYWSSSSYGGVVGVDKDVKKSSSTLSVDGTTSAGNSAYVGVSVSWSNVVASVLNGVTTYLISYSYSYGGNISATLGSGAATQSLHLDVPYTSGSDVYKYTVGSTTPVPGPIAAAGLPGLLGLIGFGLYRRRRNAA
jgi:MYXO-CTERM domain-containing protein